MILKRAFISFVIPTLLLTSCDESISNANNKSLENNQNTVSDSPLFKNSFVKKIKFQERDGAEAFSIKPKENGAKLEGIQGETIVNFIVGTNNKIQMRTSAGSILGHISIADDSWKVEDAEETTELYVLHKQTDGDYQLESGDNIPIYQIKKRDYGFEIETPEQELLYRVKRQDNKQILQDVNNKTVLETKSDFSLLAIACYGFDVLDQAQQTGLAYAVNFTE